MQQTRNKKIKNFKGSKFYNLCYKLSSTYMQIDSKKFTREARRHCPQGLLLPSHQNISHTYVSQTAYQAKMPTDLTQGGNWCTQK